MSRVLVIGASGQVGRALCLAFDPDYSVIAASNQHIEPGHRRVDLGNTVDVITLCKDVQPEIVLLAGGMFNVDACELQPDVCRRVNVAGTEAIARYVSDNGGRVVFFSTNYVFDGSRESYVETDAVAPMNVYSSTKAEAEQTLRRALPERHLILRTTGVYGYDVYRRNFVLRLIDRLRRRETTAVPLDQWGNPTFATDLAQATRWLLERNHVGTFHAVGPDFIARATFAERVCEHFNLDRSLIEPRLTTSLQQTAPRPLSVELDCRKLAATGMRSFLGVDAGLRALHEWEASLVARP